VNEGEGLTELWDVTHFGKVDDDVRGDKVCQTVGGGGTPDQQIHATYR
jgi:hypothetical protein